MDETIARLKRQEALDGKKCGTRGLWLWDHLEPAMLELADKRDWPFVSPYVVQTEEENGGQDGDSRCG